MPADGQHAAHRQRARRGDARQATASGFQGGVDRVPCCTRAARGADGLLQAAAAQTAPWSGGCAWFAHVMFEDWGGRDEDDRPDGLENLEYLIRESGVLAGDGAVAESGVLTEDNLRRFLDVARNPVSWDLLSADHWLRPRPGYDEGRGAFVSSVRAFLTETGEAATGVLASCSR
ncbi:hypothetical protein [Streptomyces syringium]|uniref:hypothetical protein n=1 Tax=Streptomyces syringium TaxID=76729 RepID=UPI00340C077E